MHVFFKLIISSSLLWASAQAQDLVVPNGLKIEIFSDQVDSPRQMTQGTRGNIFVGSRKSGNVFVIQDQDKNGVADASRKLASGLNQPAGVSFYRGDLFIAEIDKIWNNIVTAKGGFLNFDAIFKISDFAIFLPNLNKVISFLIIKFSNHYELKQYHLKDFYKNIYENYFFPLTLLIHLD